MANKRNQLKTSRILLRLMRNYSFQKIFYGAKIFGVIKILLQKLTLYFLKPTLIIDF